MKASRAENSKGINLYRTTVRLKATPFMYVSVHTHTTKKRQFGTGQIICSGSYRNTVVTEFWIFDFSPPNHTGHYKSSSTTIFLMRSEGRKHINSK
jgi:hypothetical protein